MGISSGSATVKSPLGSGELKPPTPHNGTNGSNTTLNNNNNNSKVANANAGIAHAKKTIEKVAAVLKAAATATADTTSSQRSTSTTATTTSTSSSVPTFGSRDVESNGKPQKEDKPSVAPPGEALSVATGVNRVANPSHPDSSIVTSVTTASITSVTGTNGSSRNSPASIVNVG
uniref:Uncharacterized protein n=1 Tax=Anopheles stephensi TaxID=30069 RepID=A0A182YQW0_ANOST